VSTNFDVEYVDDTKRRTSFIAADGDVETQHINESSHDWCSVVNKLVAYSQSMLITASVDFVYISRRV